MTENMLQVPALQDTLSWKQAKKLRPVRGNRIPWHLVKKRGLGPELEGQCVDLCVQGVFSYMHHWYGGECGTVGPDWCANGDDFVSNQARPGRTQNNSETYFGYCAEPILV